MEIITPPMDIPFISLQINYYLTQFLNGLVLGMILVLIALGLSIIFGLMGIINFAHGDMLLVGVYIAWAVNNLYDSWVLGLISAIITVSSIGFLIERVGLRPIYHKGPILQLLLTFGIAEVLRAGVQVVWGSTPKFFPPPEWASGSIDLGIISYPSYRLLVLSLTIVIAMSVYVFIHRTDYGLLIRAANYDREMVNTFGVDVKKLFLLTFVLGSALAGIAGALIGPIRGVNPLLGINLLIPAFVVVIVGGVRSLFGTVISGLFIGQIIVLTGIIDASFSNIIIYIFMAVILFLRPEGLFGETEVDIS